MTNLTCSQLSQKVRTKCEQTAQICSHLCKYPVRLRLRIPVKLPRWLATCSGRLTAPRYRFIALPIPYLTSLRTSKGSARVGDWCSMATLIRFPLGTVIHGLLIPFPVPLKRGESTAEALPI